MEKAASYIVGTHDFACFQSAGGTPRETTVRTIYNLKILVEKPLDSAISGQMDESKYDDSGDNILRSNISGDIISRKNISGDIVVEVTGDGFLYNMVRIIVGTLVEVGLGKREPESVIETIKSCDRTKAGHTAPPEGLYLKEVYFDEIDLGDL